MSITKTREVFSLPNVHYAKIYIEKTGLQVTEILNIQYAKKIRARLGQREAEINLFYGKRGFSVVISPRLGTNGELNSLLAELVREFLEK